MKRCEFWEEDETCPYCGGSTDDGVTPFAACIDCDGDAADDDGLPLDYDVFVHDGEDS